MEGARSTDGSYPDGGVGSGAPGEVPEEMGG